MSTDPTLEAMSRLLGKWSTEATHPSLPGVIVRGTSIVEWLEGKRFLIYRARTDHPDFPDSISVIGYTEHDRVDDDTRAVQDTAGDAQLRMHYYDSRGVFRIYDASIDDESWQLWRPAPGFSQRFTGTWSDAGDTIVGRWQLCEDDVHWVDDLQITYRRYK